MFFDTIFHSYIVLGNSIGFFNSVFFNILFVGSLLVFLIKKHYPLELMNLILFPISKSKISFILIVNSILNFFNLGLFVFIIPFILTQVITKYPSNYGFIYLTGIVLLAMASSLITFLLKNLYRLSNKFIVLILFVIFISVFFNLKCNNLVYIYFQRLSQGELSPLLFSLLLVLLLVFINYKVLLRLYYKLGSSFGFILLKSLPSYWDIIKFQNHYLLLEIRLIIRNKRLLGFLFMAIILLSLFYSLMKKNAIDVYNGLALYTLITGTFGYIYSQYMFSWESSYFEFIMARKFDIKKFIGAKYLLYVCSSIIIFFIFLFASPNLIRTNTLISATLYNISFGYFIFFLSATTNNSKIDLEGNILFNMAGFNPIQMAAITIIFILPCLVFYFLNSLFNELYSFVIFDIICLISLYFSPNWICSISNHLVKKKYKMLESFKND